MPTNQVVSSALNELVAKVRFGQVKQPFSYWCTSRNELVFFYQLTTSWAMGSASLSLDDMQRTSPWVNSYTGWWETSSRLIACLTWLISSLQRGWKHGTQNKNTVFLCFFPPSRRWSFLYICSVLYRLIFCIWSLRLRLFWLGGGSLWASVSELGAVFKFVSVHFTLNLLGLVQGWISGDCKINISMTAAYVNTTAV